MNNSIQRIYSEVSGKYELVNHVLTFRMDIAWRKKAADVAARTASGRNGARWIDVCSGTGEMAVDLSRLAGEGTQIFAADFSMPMLDKAVHKPEGKRIMFLLSAAGELPFPDDSFDLVTISFATRNINPSRDALIETFREFYRVIKPDGALINLETSQPPSSVIRKLFHMYVKAFIKPVGTMISGARAGYAYLSSTVPKFYGPDELNDIMQAAGFEKVTYQRLFFGAAAIHRGVK
jgi:demethylmenaquinone methyltransferase/2-methoxy-6-polyprenyl-1,4-benzoquinol methylase